MVTNILLSFILILLASLYYLSIRKYNYWKKKNVPHLKPTPLLGNYGDYIRMKTYMGKVTQKICQAFPKEPYIGAYYGTVPALIVQDPEIIKLVTTKDFYYFNSRDISEYTDRETVTRSMFFTYGDRWKVMRQNTSPLFTTLKLKNMFHLIQKCVYNFEELLDYETSKCNVLEMKDLMARYTMDCICSCGFGIDTNIMAKDVSIKNNPFRKISLMIFDTSYIRGYAKVIRTAWPAVFYGLGLQMFPQRIVQFFQNLLVGIYKDRDYKPSVRNDFVDMILSLKNKEFIHCNSMVPAKSGFEKKVTMKVDDEFLIAQSVVFFAAGFETSANTVSFALYELSKNMDAQERAIVEVDEYLRKNKGIYYHCVDELPYLQACLDETIRMYPIAGTLTREVTDDYTLPTGLRLEKGVRIHLPIYHLHRSSEYFPEPDCFRPERFLPENKHKIPPYVYMPFGEGPRTCIGMGFAKMQMLPGLVAILKKYRLSLADDTPHELQFTPTSLPTNSFGTIKLKFHQRVGWEQRVFNKEDKLIESL